MHRFLFRYFMFYLLILFPFMFPLCVAEGGTEGGGAGGVGGDDTPGAAAVDPQELVRQALAGAETKFKEQFKAATGFDSLEQFQTEQAKKKGEEGKLLDERTQALSEAQAELGRERIKNSILKAAAGAVDPDVVASLLAGKAKHENGTVTIDGKSPAEAVEALLKEKTYLAKPSGGQGSGAGAGANGGVVNPWSKDTFNLTKQGQIERDNPTLAATLKSSAVK